MVGELQDQLNSTEGLLQIAFGHFVIQTLFGLFICAAGVKYTIKLLAQADKGGFIRKTAHKGIAGIVERLIK